jgi:hypothetical protein
MVRKYKCKARQGEDKCSLPNGHPGPHIDFGNLYERKFCVWDDSPEPSCTSQAKNSAHAHKSVERIAA